MAEKIESVYTQQEKGDCSVTREKIGRPEGENDIKKN